MFWVTDDILMHKSRHRVGLLRRIKIQYHKVQSGRLEDTTISDNEELLNLVDTSTILRSS